MKPLAVALMTNWELSGTILKLIENMRRKSIRKLFRVISLVGETTITTTTTTTKKIGRKSRKRILLSVLH